MEGAAVAEAGALGKPVVGQKRKLSKEKRFRQNVKGYAKKGNFGRGSYLEEEQAKYFLNIIDVLSQEFDSVDSKKNLAQNVLTETVGKEELFSTNQIASKVIDSLIGFASVEIFENYLVAFSKDIRAYAQDKFSSHVLQKLVFLSALRCAENREVAAEADPLIERNYNLCLEVKMSHKNNCKEFVTKVSKFLLNNLEDLVTDQYANHVIRTCLSSLAGIQYENVVEIMLEKKIKITTSVPFEDWKEIIEEFANRLRLWPQFVDFPYEGLSSGLLQSLVCVLRIVNKDLLKSIGSFLLTESLNKPLEDHTTRLKAFSKDFSIRFLETLINVSGKKLFSKIVSTLFVGRMQLLSELKCANFSVQKIFDNVPEKEEFELLFDELQDHFAGILKVGHTGVILSICRTCERLNSRQIPFIKAIKSALNITTGGDPHEGHLIIAILKLKPVEPNQEANSFIHIHGSVILQTLLRFQKPIEIISALIEIDNAKLIPLISTAKGSYIVDVLFQAPFVGEKSKIKFIKKFEGYYLELAMNKFGSRILETIYSGSDSTQQTKIVQELSEKLNQLESIHCGFIISKKFNVAVYKASPSRWQTKKTSQNTAQKLFKGII